MSSLALIFALHHYKPTPLYVMDEIDAGTLIFRSLFPPPIPQPPGLLCNSHWRLTGSRGWDFVCVALDFKNVSIVANYIKERTKDAQFVVISLRNNMFELADRLVGIYKTENQTKSVTINPEKFAIPLSA